MVILSISIVCISSAAAFFAGKIIGLRQARKKMLDLYYKEGIVDENELKSFSSYKLFEFSQSHKNM